MNRLWKLLLLFTAMATAQSRSVVPRNISIPGRLLAADGAAISGTHAVSVALYAAEQDNAPLWEQTRIVLADKTGNYTVSVTPPASGAWIELLPAVGVPPRRMRLASVPYALRARDADNLGGAPAAAYAHTADIQHAQVLAQQYSDAATSTALSAISAEQLRARQIEAVLADQISAEATRAKAAESTLPINPLPVATPSWIITSSSTPPANYLWSGLTMQSTGVPIPEAQILLGGNPQSVSFTFYLHLRVN